jgi:sRNA-binding carbon storage regulator CsrA
MLRIYRQGGQSITVGESPLKITVAGIQDGKLLCFVQDGDLSPIEELKLALKKHEQISTEPPVEVVWLESSRENYTLGVIAPDDVEITRDDYSSG